MSSKEILVSIALGAEDIRIGKLWFHARGHKESASFEYDKAWLDHSEKFALEPALKLTEGAFYTGQGISLFGAIGDSAPDRWGRVLMRRSEASKASVQNRAPRSLSEIEYLLGVNDEARQGALRFSSASNEDVFLSPKQKNSIPPLVDLPKLLSATERFIAYNLASMLETMPATVPALSPINILTWSYGNGTIVPNRNELNRSLLSNP